MFRCFFLDWSGIVLLFVVGIIFIIIGFVGFVIDFIYVYCIKFYLYFVVEVVVFLVVSVMLNFIQVCVNVNFYVECNMDFVKFGDVVLDDNIIFGQWDKDIKIFMVNQILFNVVEVIVEFLNDNVNVVLLFFLGVFGFDFFEILVFVIVLLLFELLCIIVISFDVLQVMQLFGNIDVDLVDCVLYVFLIDIEVFYLDGDFQIIDVGYVCIGGGYMIVGMSDVYLEVWMYVDCCDDLFFGVSELFYFGCDEIGVNYNNKIKNFMLGDFDDDDGLIDIDGYFDVSVGGSFYVYCNGLIIINGFSVWFVFGVYVIEGGLFMFDMNFVIVGMGVIFFFDNGVYFDFDIFSGVSVMVFMFGLFEGILFMEVCDQGLIYLIDSGIVSNLYGFFYFLNGCFEFNVVVDFFVLNNCIFFVVDIVFLFLSIEIDMVVDFFFC